DPGCDDEPGERQERHVGGATHWAARTKSSWRRSVKLAANVQPAEHNFAVSRSSPPRSIASDSTSMLIAMPATPIARKDPSCSEWLCSRRSWKTNLTERA